VRILKGGDRRPTEGTIPAFTGGTDENHDRAQSL